MSKFMHFHHFMNSKGDSLVGPSKSAMLQKTKMATSTPNLKKKTKVKKKNEEELLLELSRVEMEKTMLQVQFTSFFLQDTLSSFTCQRRLKETH